MSRPSSDDSKWPASIAAPNVAQVVAGSAQDNTIRTASTIHVNERVSDRAIRRTPVELAEGREQLWLMIRIEQCSVPRSWR